MTFVVLTFFLLAVLLTILTKLNRDLKRERKYGKERQTKEAEKAGSSTAR